MVAREEGGKVACPLCGQVAEVDWETLEGAPLLYDACPHLQGAEWEGEPGQARFYVRTGGDEDEGAEGGGESMRTARVLRITRHPLSEAQREALLEAARLLLSAEAIEVTEHRETIQDAEEALRLAEELSAELVEVVLPLPLLAQLVPALRGRGVPVLRAVMQRELSPSGEATFTFVGYELIERVEVVAHPITGRGKP